MDINIIKDLFASYAIFVIMPALWSMVKDESKNEAIARFVGQGLIIIVIYIVWSLLK